MKDDSVTIDPLSPEPLLERAARMLATRRSSVVLNGTVRLRPTAAWLLCEVIDPDPASRRCEHEREVLLENARRMLESSRLAGFLPDTPRSWRVVEGNAR